MTQQKTVLNWIAVIGVGLLLLGNGFAWFRPVNSVDFPTADEIVQAIEDADVILDEDGEVVIPEELDVEKFNELYDAYFEVDAWEAEAQVLTEEEYEENDYKDLFRWMTDPLKGNLPIDDRDDIDRVVVKDTDFFDMEARDKNGEVVQDLKVYYEDSFGDDKKVYITVTTVFDEGEIDTQVFT